MTYQQVVDYLGRESFWLAPRAPRLVSSLLELAGYEAIDLGMDGHAQQHYLRALEISATSGERVYGGYLIAVSLAHLALHCGDAAQAARLAAAAIRGTEGHASPAVFSAFRMVLARAHARRGDEPACIAAIARAETDLARSNPADEPDWISYFGEADLADERAHCFFDLGQQSHAQREVELAIRLVEPTRVRRLAIDNALHASSLARSHQIDHACAVARQAVDHACGAASFRSAHRIVLMMGEFHPYLELPEVTELAEYVRFALPNVDHGQADQRPGQTRASQ